MSNIKEVMVTFEFNAEKDSVSNIKCYINGIEKKKRTTKKKSEVEEEMAAEAIITLEPNKLLFNNKAISILELEYEDRIIIKWDKEKGSKTMIPFIGKDIAFKEEGAGNKVTKALTVTYRGNANTLLSQLGTEFTLGEENDGIFKLVPLNGTIVNQPESIEEAISIAESIDADLIVDTDETDEIDEIQFKL